MVQLASAVLRPASLFPQRASSITARYVLFGGRVAVKVAPNGSVARTIVAAKPSLAQKPKKCTTHLFRASRRRLCSAGNRGSVEAMSTAIDISSIGTAYQIAKSRITCYDLASRHSHRRRQQGPSEVCIAVKAEQLYQNNDPEDREVVQACNSRLITTGD